ncbi:MAG: ATP-binding protein [Chthoniobacteraceae bacterium]
MFALRNIPIQRKLRLVILVTCTTALCVASSALFALQYFLFKRDLRHDLASAAQIVSGLSAPTIALGAPETTQDFLDALAAKPHITGAFVRTSDGSVASAYGRKWEHADDPRQLGDGFHNVAGEFIYVHPILNDGERVGTLVLLSDYNAASIRLHALYAGILAAVLAVSVLVAVIVSSRLERLICGPMQALAETAHRIASRSDYSLRAKKEAADEVGDFTDSFNSMLEQIEKRDVALNHEIVERTRAEGEVQRVHRQLMDASRLAGMAEVATGVLHNVGNVLNSVNVSATLIAERLGCARVEKLVRAVQLLREQNGTLARFLAEDPKGRVLPAYLVEATEQLASDRASALAEIDLLVRNIEHIKDIVAMQQNYARVSGMIETLDARGLIEDAIRMNLGAFERHRVTLERDYAEVAQISADKHKVLQILVNLIRNAKYAIDEGGTGERKITTRLRMCDENIVAIEVIDTGIGIPAENLTRIFAHGFTTREEGHGFGLHSAALAAQQMGGSLRVASEGPGHGATFTLELPVVAPAREPVAPTLPA